MSEIELTPAAPGLTEHEHAVQYSEEVVEAYAEAQYTATRNAAQVQADGDLDRQAAARASGTAPYIVTWAELPQVERKLWLDNALDHLVSGL